MPKSVCIPVDDSPGSQRAVEWSVKNAISNPNDKLALLCVRNVLSDPFAVEAASTPVCDPTLTEGANTSRQSRIYGQ